MKKSCFPPYLTDPSFPQLRFVPPQPGPVVPIQCPLTTHHVPGVGGSRGRGSAACTAMNLEWGARGRAAMYRSCPARRRVSDWQVGSESEVSGLLFASYR